MPHILIVDDEELIRNLICQMLEAEGYDCSIAANASEGRELLTQKRFELILCDINMPGESGPDFMRFVLKEYPDTASIMVTGMDDPVLADDVLKMGVYDYIIKPFEQNGVLISVANALRRRQLEIDNRSYRRSLEKMVEERTTALQESETRLRAIFEAAEHVAFIMIDHVDTTNPILEFSPGAERLLGFHRNDVIGRTAEILHLPDDIIQSVDIPKSANEIRTGFTRESILKKKSGKTIPASFTTYPIFNAQGTMTAILIVCIDISEQKRADKELKTSMSKLGKALEGSIQAIAKTVERRDPYTAGHQQRVADLACAIANALGLSEDRAYGLRLGGLIHDLGKICVPAEILSKPGRISDIEFNLIKTHCEVGYDILEAIEFPWPIAQMVLQHHERMNGSGYPAGLSGEEILFEARILGIADVVEAMASHRPYRPALGLHTALEEIKKNKGILYDDAIADVSLKLLKNGGFQFK